MTRDKESATACVRRQKAMSYAGQRKATSSQLREMIARLELKRKAALKEWKDCPTPENHAAFIRADALVEMHMQRMEDL